MFLTQFSKVIFVANDKQLLFCEHRLQEISTNFLAELPDRVHGRIDFPIQYFLRAGEAVNNFAEIDPADNQQIHVAVFDLPGTSDGAIDERKVNPVMQWIESIHQDVVYADRFVDQVLDFPEDRALFVGTVERLDSDGFSGDKTSSQQLPHLALHRPEVDCRKAGELAQIVGFANVAVQDPEHGAPRLAEEGFG